MNPTSRRDLLLVLLAAPLLLPSREALAQSGVDRALQRLGGAAPASALSAGDATGGIKEALAKGVEGAIRQLGRTDGFLGDAAVKILVPERIRQVADLARKAGQGARVDAFEESMNRTAEKAVPAAADILGGAVRDMSVQDAVGILQGGDNAVTAYFARKTREPLTVQFQPVVNRSLEKLSVTQRYNDLAGKAQQFGLLKGQGATLQDHVTGKALDALYMVIGEEERKIRQDPVGTGSALLKKVFGAL